MVMAVCCVVSLGGESEATVRGKGRETKEEEENKCC